MNSTTHFTFFLTTLLLLIVSLTVSGQNEKKKKVRVKAGREVVLPDTVFVTTADTVLLLSPQEAKELKIGKDPYAESDEFYDSLEQKISKKPVVGDIFNWMVTNDRGKVREVNIMLQSELVFMQYSGYTIGSITFKSIDILEGSVVDTLQKASTRLGKLINRIHRDTRVHIVESNLLFNSGDPVDPYQLADNERILRRFGSIRDARIYLYPQRGNSKVVDVEIVTQDLAPLGAIGNFTSWQWYDAAVYHVNLLGYAKQLQIAYFRNTHREPNNGYEITVRDPNMFGSFIRGEVQYADNYIHERVRVAFERNFFAPEVKYAGGLELYQTHENYYSEGYDTLEAPYTEDMVDFWGGRSFEFKKRSNLIFTGRVQTRNFQERPFVDVDSNQFFYDRTLALGSIALAKRNFLKATKIIGFGITEDVPIGSAVIATIGKEWNEFTNRSYLGFMGTIARYSSGFGYLNMGVGVGSFLNGDMYEDGALNIESIYFSNLRKIQRSQMRQFIYGRYTLGINRQINKTLLLPGKWEGPNNIPPIGTERLQVGFQTIYFLPWYAYGFQFAFFHTIEINLLNVNEDLFAPSSLFPLFEVGLRTLNDNLVFPTLSISFGYYAKNRDFDGAFQFKISTQLRGLFRTEQIFKPRVVAFE